MLVPLLNPDLKLYHTKEIKGTKMLDTTGDFSYILYHTKEIKGTKILQSERWNIFTLYHTKEIKGTKMLVIAD